MFIKCVVYKVKIVLSNITYSPAVICCFIINKHRAQHFMFINVIKGIVP